MGWAFFYMFVILKIPVCAALYLVWWASREPETTDEDSREGGGSDRRDHPRPRKPGPPRRGPHAGIPPAAPQRVRTAAARRLRTHR